jgi:hypothetical protein
MPETLSDYVNSKMRDYTRPCPDCPYHKASGCSKWSCVAEEQYINALIKQFNQHHAAISG